MVCFADNNGFDGQNFIEKYVAKNMGGVSDLNVFRKKID